VQGIAAVACHNAWGDVFQVSHTSAKSCCGTVG
jgi:hypothetical protein